MQMIKNCLAATLLVIGLGLSASSFSASSLPPVDSLINTYYDKSVVAGALRKDPSNAMGMGFAQDAAHNFLFDYTGQVYSVDTNAKNAQLNGLIKQIGTVEGTAAFPVDFAMLAMGMAAYMNGAGPMPSVPASIPWTCNHCKIEVGGSTYTSIVDVAGSGMFDDASIEAMRLKGRAFTGLGPVEVGKMSAQSMSVRMAGCSAVVGIAGPDEGKLGTICLNGTFTFDLAGLAQGKLEGTGTSNCITVMHTPLSM